MAQTIPHLSRSTTEAQEKDIARPIIAVLIESWLILAVPLLVCKILSLPRLGDHEPARLYISVLVAVSTATVVLASLVRIELPWRHGLWALGACILAIVFLTTEQFRVISRDSVSSLTSVLIRSSEIGRHTAQFVNVLFVDGMLIGAGWSASQLFARGVKRPSYLVLAGMAAAIGDLYSVGGGPTRNIMEDYGDMLASRIFLQWFVIGDQSFRPLMGPGDLLFLGLFLWGARRFNFDVRLNVIAQIIGLAVAYAIVLGFQLPIPGLVFIGPVFIAVNWKRFEISAHDWRAMACLVAGLLIAIVTLTLMNYWK